MEAVSPVELASPPIPSNNPVSPPPRLRRSRAPVIGIAVGGLFALMVAFALSWIAIRPTPRARGNNTADSPFCCPREAAQLFAVIDSSISPCKDFFAYVCKEAIAQGYVQQGVAKDILNTISGNVIRGTKFYDATAAAALNRLYTSCLRELWQPELRGRDTAEAVLAIGNTGNPMSPVDMLRFLLNAQFRYRLTFLFFIDYYIGKRLIFKKDLAPIEQLVFECGGVCSGFAVSLVNDRLQTNYTIPQLIEWENLFLASSTSPGRITATLAELGNAFGGLNTSVLKAELHEIGIDYNHEEILVYPEKAFLSEIQSLWDASNQPLSLCYMLTAVSLDASVRFETGSDLDSPNIESSKICDSNLYHYKELWRVTYVTALTNPAKNAQLRKIFEATRKALVNYKPLRLLMAAGNDTHLFESVVANMSLLLPDDLIIRDVAIPRLSAEGFIHNHFQATSFEFEVMVAKWRRGIPQIRDDLKEGPRGDLYFVNETTLYVPAPLFGLLSENTTDPLLADAPVVASRMATLMSEEVTYRTWSNKTRNAMSLHRQCVIRSTPVRIAAIASDVLVSTMGLHIAAATVGAVSTFSSGVPVTADWLHLKPAWSLYLMSKAQFFYARYAYFQCSVDDDSRPLLNEPLRLSPDFGLAFKCPVDAHAASSIACASATQ